MNPLNLDVNKTTTFLLPILFPDSTHDEIFSNYLKQAYLGVLDSDDVDFTILLEFDEDKVTPDLIEDFINNIQAKGTVKEIKDNLVTYTLDQEFDKFQYEHFLAGRYSKFAPQTKLSIIDFWKEPEGGGSLLHGILYNTPEIVNEHADQLDGQMIQELKELNEESWPPPNLFVDEFLLV